jgi:hypothetical protein
MSDEYQYEPVHRSGRWEIQATSEDGEVMIIKCDDATLEEVWERIRVLRLDDDRIDGAAGEPRKYQ